MRELTSSLMKKAKLIETKLKTKQRTIERKCYEIECSNTPCNSTGVWDNIYVANLFVSQGAT